MAQLMMREVEMVIKWTLLNLRVACSQNRDGHFQCLRDDSCSDLFERGSFDFDDFDFKIPLEHIKATTSLCNSKINRAFHAISL